MVKDIIFGDDFYGKPLLVVITDNNARIPIFSHNEIIEVEDRGKMN